MDGMKVNNRILYWDVIKCVAIYLVIWGHSIQCMNESAGWNDPIDKIIISFHMPFFMMVSGYFSRSVFKMGIIETFLKKGRQLVLPSVSTYFLVGIILIIVRHVSFPDGIVSLLNFCTTSFWFLKALFVFYLFTTILIKLWRRSKILLFILVILGVAIIPSNWLNYANCIATYPFFLMGLVYWQFEDIILTHKKTIAFFSLLIYFAMSYFNDVADYQMYTHLFTWSSLSIAIFITRTIIGVSASLFLILFIRSTCLKIETNNILKIMADIGTCTLGIYVFQYWVVERLLLVMRNKYECILGYFSDVAIDFFVAPVYSFVALLVCWRLVKFVRNYKFAKLIILGEK